MYRAGPDYRRGDRHPNIAIVGACPGEQEEKQDRPFIGDAGAHLATMVPIINEICPVKFPSALGDDYTLLNAHPLPRYPGRAGYNGDTEPCHAAVISDENIARLIEQLKQTAINRLLLAGRRPQWLAPRVVAEFAELEIYICGHPSPSAWNRRYVGHPRMGKIRLWTHETFQMAHPFWVQQ